MISVRTQSEVTSGVTRWNLSPGMQSFQKRDQGRGFRRTQILSVGGHVTASLDYLADQLVLRKSHGDAIERGPSLAAQVSESMAVAALLDLEDERALPLESSSAV
jgi:hypothetical protein